MLRKSLSVFCKNRILFYNKDVKRMSFKCFRFFVIGLAGIVFMASCTKTGSSIPFSEARRTFSTVIAKNRTADEEVPVPPKGSGLKLVAYETALGKMAAYISGFPMEKNKKYPAIIWVCGGFDSSIGSYCWEDAAKENDQSAAVFREKGIVTMYPSFRGCNMNSGKMESFYGEVDDILSAYEYLAAQPFVDKNRIYLGGHSTGGTTVLLAAEACDKFRAVFSLGPVAKIDNYEAEDLVFDVRNKQEVKMRSPIFWLDSIKTPVFIFEGGSLPSNVVSLRQFELANRNGLVKIMAVDGYDHFSVIYPLTQIISDKINNDAGTQWNQTFSKEDFR